MRRPGGLCDSDGVSEMEESTTRWPVPRALLQVGLAGGVGALALPFGFMGILVAVWAGGIGRVLGAGVLYMVIVLAALVLVASLVPEASSLTRGTAGRVGWALIVAGLGTVAWFFAFAVYGEVNSEVSHNAMMAIPLSAVPYALVAGLLLRRWYLKLGALVLVVASGFGLLAVLAGTVPNELDARLAAARVDRGTVFVAQIPGYHRVPQLNALVLVPDDPQSVPPPRFISLYAYPDDPTGDCQADPRDTDHNLSGFPCTVEQPGLTYTPGAAEHQYVYRKGTLRLRIVGTIAVDRDVLRDAIRSARPTAVPEVYTTDVEGYEAVPLAGPAGTLLQVKDMTQVAYAKQVEVSASPVAHAGECAEFQKSGASSSGFLECVTERPGLSYQRLADQHLYYAQHGSVEVRVTGGLGVDRDLLRDAAVSARPATDEELLATLPPGPTARRTFMSRLKGLAKGLFG